MNMNWMAWQAFLGTTYVYTNFYWLPSDVLEIAKISKLFLAAERGKLLEFAGKELTDIIIADDEPVDTSDASDCEDATSESVSESVRFTAGTDAASLPVAEVVTNSDCVML